MQYVWEGNTGLVSLVGQRTFSVPVSLLDTYGSVENNLFCKIFLLTPLSYQLKGILTFKSRL